MKHHEDRLETFTLLVIHNTLKQVREPFGAWHGMAWLGSGWVGWVQPALAAPIIQHGVRAETVQLITARSPMRKGGFGRPRKRFAQQEPARPPAHGASRPYTATTSGGRGCERSWRNVPLPPSLGAAPHGSAVRGS